MEFRGNTRIHGNSGNLGEKHQKIKETQGIWGKTPETMANSGNWGGGDNKNHDKLREFDSKPKGKGFHQFGVCGCTLCRVSKLCFVASTS